MLSVYRSLLILYFICILCSDGSLFGVLNLMMMMMILSVQRVAAEVRKIHFKRLTLL